MIATGFRPLRTPVSERPASATAVRLDPAAMPPLPCPAVAPTPPAGGCASCPARPSPPVHQAPVPGSGNRHWLYRRLHPGEPGQCLFDVDNFAGNVDGATARNFFRAQAVDGIDAGSGPAAGQTLCRVPTRILSLRTVRPACLHRISTGLCTP